MSVPAFVDILQGPFAQYLSVSKQIGGDVATHSQLVEQSFQAQLQYLTYASNAAQPSSQDEQMMLLKPTSDQINAIQNFREKNRASVYFNHLSAISESIPALGWVTVVSSLYHLAWQTRVTGFSGIVYRYTQDWVKLGYLELEYLSLT